MTDLDSKPSLFLTCSVLMAGLFAAFMSTAVLPAEPLIIHQFSLPRAEGGVAFVYSFVSGIFAGLLICGPAARRLGGRRIEIATLALIASTLLCTVAWNSLSLALPRLLQGFTATLVILFAMGFIAVNHPEIRRIGLLGILLLVAWSGSILGSMTGSILVDRLSWHWCFLIALPTGLVALVMLRMSHR